APRQRHDRPCARVVAERVALVEYPPTGLTVADARLSALSDACGSRVASPGPRCYAARFDRAAARPSLRDHRQSNRPDREQCHLAPARTPLERERCTL